MIAYLCVGFPGICRAECRSSVRVVGWTKSMRIRNFCWALVSDTVVTSPATMKRLFAAVLIAARSPHVQQSGTSIEGPWRLNRSRKRLCGACFSCSAS
jgi:hypothetical protein